MSKRLYVDFHAIQTIQSSCLSRDGSGVPKTMVYGGMLRTGVSSQAWKRAMRLMFQDIFTSGQPGYRTRKISSLVQERICAENPDMGAESVEKMTAVILGLAGVGADRKDELFFASDLQVAALAKLAVEYAKDTTNEKERKKVYKNRVENALKENPSVDCLLFGRKPASGPSLNYDSAVQVASGISTHTLSGYIGTIGLGYTTLYRYANVNVGELAQHLKADEIKQAVRGLADAFVRSMPTGKQNTFADGTLPDMVYVTFREDHPVYLEEAFQMPVTAGTKGYIAESEKALLEYVQEMYASEVAPPWKAWIVGNAGDDVAERVTLAELLEKIADGIGQYCAERG